MQHLGVTPSTLQDVGGCQGGRAWKAGEERGDCVGDAESQQFLGGGHQQHCNSNVTQIPVLL